MKKILLLASFSLCSLTGLAVTSPRSLTSPVTKSFKVDKHLETIHIHNHTGNINVIGNASDDVKVSVQLGKWDHGCELYFDPASSIARGTKQIKVEAGPPTFSFMKECVANITVHLPPQVNLEMDQAHGHAIIDSMMGRIDVKARSGNINVVNANLNRFDAKAWHGTINFTGALREAHVWSGTGDVSFALHQVPQEGSLIVESAKGKVAVQVPEGIVLNTHISAGGKLFNEIPTRSDANFTVSIRNLTGDVYVQKLH